MSINANVPDSTPNPEQAAPGSSSPAKRPRPLNSFKHGLTARKFVFSPEESEAYHAHFASIQSHYKPQGPIEEALVRQIVDGIWRLDRASSIEHGIFATALESLPQDADETDAALAPARTWLAEAKNLALLTLYVKRIQNKLDHDKKELGHLQSARVEPAAKPETVVLRPDPKGPPIKVRIDGSDPMLAHVAHELARLDAMFPYDHIDPDVDDGHPDAA